EGKLADQLVENREAQDSCEHSPVVPLTTQDHGDPHEEGQFGSEARRASQSEPDHIDHPGQGDEEGGDEEHLPAVLLGHLTGGCDTDLVVLERPEEAAVRRPHQPLEEQHGHGEQSQRDDEEEEVVVAHLPPQRLGDVGETGGAVGHCRDVDEERLEDFGKGEGGEGEILAPQTQGGPARNGGEDHSYETGDQRRQQRMEIESPSILIEGRLAGWSRREDGGRVGADGEVGDDAEVDQTRFPVLEVERDGHHTVDPDQDADADDSREQRAHSVLPEIPLGMKIRTRITIPKAMMSLKPAPIHSRETSRATPMARADTTSDQIDPTPARSATAKM